MCLIQCRYYTNETDYHSHQWFSEMHLLNKFNMNMSLIHSDKSSFTVVMTEERTVGKEYGSYTVDN